MNKMIVALMSLGLVGIQAPLFAESTGPCVKEVSQALLKLPGSGYNEQECTLNVRTSPFGAGFGIVGEATANCELHISPVSVDHTITRWSVHFRPGSCHLLSITPESAPPAALESSQDGE